MTCASGQKSITRYLASPIFRVLCLFPLVWRNLLIREENLVYDLGAPAQLINAVIPRLRGVSDSGSGMVSTTNCAPPKAYSVWACGSTLLTSWVSGGVPSAMGVTA